MEKKNGEIKYCSEFNVALFFIPVFFVAIIVVFGFVNLISGRGDYDFSDIGMSFLLIVIPLLPIFIFYKRVDLYPDRLEVYNVFNKLQVRIYFKDIKTIKYLNSESGGIAGVFGPKRSYQSIVVITSKANYSFNSIFLLNLKAFKAALQAYVILSKQ